MQHSFSRSWVLRTAASNNATLLAQPGPRAPYSGRLDVMAVGALADLLLVAATHSETGG